MTLQNIITEDDDRISLLYRLNELADGNSGFKSDFLDSVDKQFRACGYISEQQWKCLGIIEKEAKFEGFLVDP